MEATFWSLVPAIVAIVLALITKEVYISLLTGILGGALFYTGFKLIPLSKHCHDHGDKVGAISMASFS